MPRPRRCQRRENHRERERHPAPGRTAPANRLAQFSRTEAIRHGEQGEEVLLDARGDAVERNRDVGGESGEIGIAGIDELQTASTSTCAAT